MKTKDSFNRNQFIALGTVVLLSPALRLIPGRPAAFSGRAAWLTPAAAVPVLLLYVYFISRFMAARQNGEGLAELTLRALGKKAGVPVLLLFSAWLLLYGGFILRSGADRLITTIYPQSSPGIFTIVMGIISLVAALGSARSIARVAKMVLPVVLSVLLFVLLFGLFSADKANLLPVTYHDAAPVLLGSLAVVDVVAVVLYIACFFSAMMPKEEGRFKAYSIWLGCVCLLLTALSIAVVGSFGPELTARLARPFFALVRNLVFFNSLERVEALVVTLWVFPDFLLVSMLLFSAQLCLRRAMGQSPFYQGEGLTDISRGRWVIWLCGTAVMAVGLFIGSKPHGLTLWSNTVIPLINLGFAFAVVPLIYLVGKLRKKL